MKTELRGVYVAKVDGHDSVKHGNTVLNQRIQEQLDDARRCGAPRAIIVVNGRRVGDLITLPI